MDRHHVMTRKCLRGRRGDSPRYAT
jgi:hypothetical protein